jgi:hypothetical protein
VQKRSWNALDADASASHHASGQDLQGLRKEDLRHVVCIVGDDLVEVSRRRNPPRAVRYSQRGALVSRSPRPAKQI